MPVTVTAASYASAIAFTYAAGTTFRPFGGPFQDASVGTLAIGTAAGQVNREYAAQVTLTVGTPTVIDLTALSDENGQSFALAAIEAIKITNKSATAGQNVTVGGGTNAVFGAFPVVLAATARGDSPMLIVTPITVDATHKTLQLSAAGTAGATLTVLLSIVGR